MKKLLSAFLAICLIFTVLPFSVAAAEADLIFGVSVDQQFYYAEDTVTVTVDLKNNADGFTAIRGRLNYDSDNLTFVNAVCTISNDSEEALQVSFTNSQHDGYIQLLWSVSPGLSNYTDDCILAELTFTINKKAANKIYDFDFEYIDGSRYVYGDNFKDTTWEYVTEVECGSASMLVDSNIDSKLYFENPPTGAYKGENLTLDIAFSGEIGLYIFKSKLYFENDSYQFISCEGLSDSLNLSYNAKDDHIVLLFDNSSPENFNEEEIIARITFSVKNDTVATDSKFRIDYVDGVVLNFDNGVTVENTVFGTNSCIVPVLDQKIPVSLTLNRGNSSIEQITVYAGEKLILPDTNFVDKVWYTDPSASIESIYNKTICPETDLVLYSSACAVDYSGDDFIVPYRYNQQLSIEKDGNVELLSYSSDKKVETATMFRLSKLTDNKTYKISVTYKANIDGKLGFGFASGTGNNMYVNTSYFEGDATTSLYNITTSANYKTADIYFTASVKGKVEEQSAGDDTKFVNGNGWTYLLIIDENTDDNDSILIKDVEITEIDSTIKVGGASILNNAGFIAAGNKQALRYFFSYTTSADGDGNVISLDGKNYSVISRGFLYRNGATEKYLDNNSVTKEGMNCTAANNNSEIIVQSKSSDFNQCWDYDSDKNSLCFSTYVNNYTEDMYSRKLMVRAFVTFRDADGNEFTIYSAPINRSISGIMNNPVSGVDVL